MTKEWLDFYGGLFVFLAALVPIATAIIGFLCRKLTVRGAFALLMTVFTGAVILLWMLAYLLHWSPIYRMAFLTLYLLTGTMNFIFDDRTISRRDTGLFVLTMTLAAVTLAVELSVSLRAPPAKRAVLTSRAPSSHS